MTVIGRTDEMQALAERLAKRQSFLLHGPAGVGKTLLLRMVLASATPGALYCAESGTLPEVLQELLRELTAKHDPHVYSRAGKLPQEVKGLSAANAKGIVAQAMSGGRYQVVLDHIGFTSQPFAAAIREMIAANGTPLVVAARSAHMEDVGFLLKLFPDRKDRLEIRNLAPPAAADFARQVASHVGVLAENLDEVVERTVELTSGNPGAIIAVLQMAKDPKYRSGDYVKVTPLYFDYRLFSSHSRHA